MATESFSGAVRWAFAMNWGQQGVQSVVTLLLAAILGPEAFGLIAMALVYLGFFQIFLGLGLSSALIQRSDLSQLHLDTAFWLVTASTAAVVALSTLGSGPWARFNHTPDLAPVILALIPSLAFRGLAIVHQAHLQKQMDFRSLAIRSNVAAVASGLIALTMALAGYGVWALVAQQLFSTFAEASLLWILNRWRPRLRFSAQVAAQLLHFSHRVLVSRLGVFTQRRSDALVIGYLFGPMALAIYRMAERLMQLVIELATRPVAIVALPNFSRLYADPGSLRSAALTTLKTSSVLSIPALVVVATVSPALIALLGPDWSSVAPVLRILCVLGAVRATTLFTGSLLQAVGRPGLLAAMQWALAAVNFAGFATVGVWLGESDLLTQISGIALARTGIYGLLFAPVSLLLLLHFSGNTVAELLQAVLPSLLGALAAALGVAIARNGLAGGGLDPWLDLTLQVTSGALCSIVVLWVVDRDFRSQVALLRAHLRSPKH